MADKQLNLYQKLLKITDEIGKIEKTGKNSMQGYSFIEQAHIVAELRSQLQKYGVFIIPETVSRTIERFENKKGTITVHANVISRYTVINADIPEERFTSEWDGGEAMDTSDKATNKAVTASQKYYLMKLFNISDKDDGDADSPELTTYQHSSQSNTGSKPRYASMKQIELMVSKVKWGLKTYDKDEIINWLDKVIGKDFNQVLASEVDDALAKIDRALREDKVAGKVEQTVPPTVDTVEYDIPDNINLDNIAY